MGYYFDQACSVVDLPAPPLTSGSFWRKDLPVMVDGQVVKGGMWEKQRLWWELPNFIKAMVGGFGSGKTSIGAKRIISSALQNAPAPVAYVAPTFPLARHTGIATLRTLLYGKQKQFGRKFWYRYNKSTHEFFLRFRGREGHIICQSAEDPESLRGPNLGAAWLDEPFLMEEEVFHQMIARIRHPSADHKELLLSGTPEALLNWGYDLILGELKDRHDVGWIQVSSRENLATGADYIRRLEGSFTEKAGEAYIEGAFVNLGTGLVYYAFGGIGSANVAKLGIPYDVELGCGMDFNVNPMSAVVFWRSGNHVHVVDEIEMPNADTEYLCSCLREWYVDPGPKKVTRQDLKYIYPDASGSARKTSAPGGKSDFYYIRQAGFEVRAKSQNPLVRDRENAVNGKFKPKSGLPSLTIEPTCKKLIKYLQTHSHENKNTEDGRRRSHVLDAFGYPIAYLYPVSKDVLGVYKLQGV